MFGAGIWLVAQVFQINAHWPDGIWWWALGTLPVALCLDTLVVHCLLVGLLAVWAGSELIGFPHLGAFWGLFPNGAYTLLPMAALGLAWSYRKGLSWGVALYAALLSWWIILQAFSSGRSLLGPRRGRTVLHCRDGPADADRRRAPSAGTSGRPALAKSSARY